MRRMLRTVLLLPLALLALPLIAQQNSSPQTASPRPPTSPFKLIPSTSQPTITPAQLVLLELEGRFQQEVETGGGKAFATWFAPDAVALNNGKPALLGRGAIADSAQWKPTEYQLRWTPQGAQMGPSNDMGFTWGHYSSHYTGADGRVTETSGRYITIWKKGTDGTWKVAMDASADEPPAAAACCTVPTP